MDLEIIILSEVKDTYDFTYMWNLKKQKPKFKLIVTQTQTDGC